MSIRDLVSQYRQEVGNASDLLPDRAAEILANLSALLGNVLDEIREADMAYNQKLLECYQQEEKANRARIRAEITPEYQRKREARDTEKVVLEMIRALKFFLREKENEYKHT